jgi:hypothetical protein
MPQISKEKIEKTSLAITTGKDVHKVLDMLQGLLDQPAGKPVVVVVYKPKMLRVGALNRDGLALPEGTKLYTHPAPSTPITADMVTDEMLEVIEDEISMGRNAWDLAHHKELIAAAVNAYLEAKK